MKRWLKRAGMAFGVLTLLIVAFYLEENWRGARLWAETKAQYEAKGFNFDPKSLIPPPVPDEQNFAKSEIWLHLLAAKDESKGKDRPKSTLFEAKKEVQEWQFKNKAFPHWEIGQIFTAPALSFFDSAQNELKQLYGTSDRLWCQFPTDWGDEKPFSARMPELNTVHYLAQVLQAHALSAMSAKPGMAIQDISLCLKLAEGCSDNPILIYSLVSCSTTRMALAPIWLGIETHKWKDQQLAGFQRQLAQIDLLKSYHLAYQGSFVFYFIKTADWMKAHRLPASGIARHLGIGDGQFYNSRLSRILFIIGPSGWYDMTKSQAARVYLDTILPTINIETRQVDYSLRKRLLQNESNPFNSYLPTTLLLAFMTEGTSGCIEKIVMTQNYLDLAQLACGLERYRLANGKYPATLAELEPKFIERVPHDLCTGEPLHYRVESDGNYALYSVGFNSVDDGGKIVMRNESFSLVDLKQGDWGWPRSTK